MTVTGTGFPNCHKKVSATIEGVAVEVIDSTPTQIQLRTLPLSTASPEVVITIFGESVSKTMSASVSDITVASVSPSDYSPVLKTSLTLTITNGGAAITDAADLECELVSATETIKMRVLSVSGNTIEVKYPGSYPGS